MTQGREGHLPLEELLREAKDPATGAHRLADLAVAHPELWEAILRNPGCDPRYREWILAQRPDLAIPAGESVTPVAQAEPTWDQVVVTAPMEPQPAPPTRRGRRRGRRTALVLGIGLGALVLVLTGTVAQTLLTGGSFPFGPEVVAGRDEVPVDHGDGAPEPSDGGDAEGEGALDTDTTASTDGIEPAGSGTSDSTATPERPEDDAANAGDGSDATGPEAPETTASESTSDDDTGSTSDGAAGERPERSATAPISDPTYTFTLERDDSYALISSPSQNISCELGGSTFGCSIEDRPEDAGCTGDRVASYLSYDGLEPTPNCGVAYLGEEGHQVLVLEYGETITDGYTSCRSQETGFTCWSEDSGHGMTLSRNHVELF